MYVRRQIVERAVAADQLRSGQSGSCSCVSHLLVSPLVPRVLTSNTRWHFAQLNGCPRQHRQGISAAEVRWELMHTRDIGWVVETWFGASACADTSLAISVGARRTRRPQFQRDHNSRHCQVSGCASL